MAKTMSEAILDTKSAIANKLLQDDGTITDITGKEVVSTDEGYNSKPALPNKFLNPDGTYSTLNEIIASMVDTSIFVIVDELPATGDPQKIYLVPDGAGGFIEYHWMGDKWDAVGVVDIDLSNYPTLQDMANAIEAAALATLNSAKNYTDNAIANIPQKPEVYYTERHVSGTNITSGEAFTFWKNLYDPTNNQPFIVCYADKTAGVIERYFIWYFANHNFENNVGYIGYANRNGEMEVTYNEHTQIQFGSSSVKFHINNNQIESIDGAISVSYKYILETGVAYQSPYIPEYAGSPTTKKYVDDAIANNITNVLGGEY